MSDIFQSAGYAAKKTVPAKPVSFVHLFSNPLELLNGTYVTAFHVTGSRFICNPPVTNTDEDYVVLIKSEEALKYFKDRGFIPSINDAYKHMNTDGFVSFRRGDVNLIVTSRRRFYDNFVKATNLAKEFNLTNKKHRIMLFEAMRAGKPVAKP